MSQFIASEDGLNVIRADTITRFALKQAPQGDWDLRIYATSVRRFVVHSSHRSQHDAKECLRRLWDIAELGTLIVPAHRSSS